MPRIKKTVRAIAALVRKHGLSLSESKLGNRSIKIVVLYSGGESVSRLLGENEITFAKAGSKGEWIAILPAETLFSLLETEAAYGKFHAANTIPELTSALKVQ